MEHRWPQSPPHRLPPVLVSLVQKPWSVLPVAFDLSLDGDRWRFFEVPWGGDFGWRGL
jgi:hypothetical protein